jgi:hypothetical protein
MAVVPGLLKSGVALLEVVGLVPEVAVSPLIRVADLEIAAIAVFLALNG